MMWDYADGKAAQIIEGCNRRALKWHVRAAYYHFKAQGVACPTEALLKEFHHTATVFLLSSPGEYRKRVIEVVNREGKCFTSCLAEEVPGKMQQLFKWLKANLKAESEINTLLTDLATSLLDIHPFWDGNGRATRAFMSFVYLLRTGRFIDPEDWCKDRKRWNKAFDVYSRKGKCEPLHKLICATTGSR